MMGRIARSTERKGISRRFATTRRLSSENKGDKAAAQTEYTASKKATETTPSEFATPKMTTEERISGVDAISTLTTEQIFRNYATAGVLITFVVGVWYYSIQAVGRADSTTQKEGDVGISELIAEAEEARTAASRRQAAKDRETQAIQEMDHQVSDEERALMADTEKLVVAVAAPDDVARKEEERNLQARGITGTERPLWKKIVFFWK